MLNWNDLKYLLATVQHGSFSMAGRALGVNRTTVARRVAVLEKQLDAPLLEQSGSGYQLTSVGEEVIASARQLESQVNELEQKLSGDSQEISGALRVAVPLGLGPEFMPELAAFTSSYPRIEMELINTTDPMASLNQRKADVGIGVAHQLPDYLDGEKAGDLHRAVYASRSYLKRYHADLATSEHLWVGWGREMAYTQVAKWMQHHVSGQANVPLRVNSWHALREAVANGMGLGHMWCFLADGEPALQQISDVIEELTIGLWVFRHADISNNQRVEAFHQVVSPLLRQRIAS